MFKDVTIPLGGKLPPSIRSILGADGFRRVSQGIYDECGFNFTNLIDTRGWEEYGEHADVPSYGVADSIEQFLEKYGTRIALNPRGCAVGFTVVTRASQPPSGGWRWHKWGEYIGKHEPEHEYLYDEKKIESVVTFSVIWEAEKP